MQIFYCTETDGRKAIFSHDESQHCVRVLRMRNGDSVTFTDGRGNLYEGCITSADQNKTEVTVISVKKEYGRRNYRLHMAISPLKNNDRLEWFIEKAVETGVDEITPVICNRTEKIRVRNDRLEGIILSAMKQSVKAYRPLLNEPVEFDEFVGREMSGRKIIAHCNDEPHRVAVTEVIGKGEANVIMIGPEGDFTQEEVKNAVSTGYISVHLGDSRLRTETAGLVACCSVYLANLKI